MKSTTKQWAWGPSAHWKLYFSLKRFTKKFYYHVSTGVESRRGYNTTCSNDSRDKILTNSTRRLCSTRSRKSTERSSSFGSRCFSSASSCTSSSRSDFLLSNDQVNQAIWKNENVIYFDSQGMRCETNQLASNQPSEDQLFVTRSYLNEGDVLVGVIDGHGGSTLGKVIKARLPYYLHSSLCDKNVYMENSLSPHHLVENMIDDHDTFSIDDEDWRKDLDLYMNDLINNDGKLLAYVSQLGNYLAGHSIYSQHYGRPYENITDAIRTAFMRLDHDLIREVRLLSETNRLDPENLGLALSGCCAIVAYIMEDELFVANSGDCRAVLGTNSNGMWSSVQLTSDHTAAANSEEVQRILAEHPVEEARSCIQYGRLLGRLAPLRAFGDIQFKLNSEELQSIFKVMPNYKLLPGLRSPPYLTAEPDVFHYKLESSDKFVVLASDGLWDMLSNDEVIELVAAYIEGTKIDMLKERAHLFGVANCNDIISDPYAFSDTTDENVASFLIRFALGGYDQENLRSMLALPYPDVRLYRDDITVSVIFLDRYNQ